MLGPGNEKAFQHEFPPFVKGSNGSCDITSHRTTFGEDEARVHLLDPLRALIYDLSRVPQNVHKYNVFFSISEGGGVALAKTMNYYPRRLLREDTAPYHVAVKV